MALPDLGVGQPFVQIFSLTYVFELAGFKTDEHITLQPRAGSLMSRLASVSNTYSVHPDGDGSRLHVRVLLMMGKQSLAERDALTAV